MDSSNNVCTPCNIGCLTCADNAYCLTCDINLAFTTPLFLNDVNNVGKCAACPTKNFVDSANVCLPCNIGCLTCVDNVYCLTCDLNLAFTSPTFLFNG